MTKLSKGALALSAISFGVATAGASTALNGKSWVKGDFIGGNGGEVIIDVSVSEKGDVKGTYTNYARSGDIILYVVDEVIFSADGHTAYMHGTVTYDKFGTLPVGTDWIKAFSDNDQKKTTTLDTNSFSYLGLSPLESYIPFLDSANVLPILQGELEVHRQV